MADGRIEAEKADRLRAALHETRPSF
jgi:hypothetical protein